jgi:protein SCO1/2
MKRIAVLLLFLLFFGCAKQAQPELIVYGSVPNFSLTDRDGNTITLQDLAGKVWIADFIFTNCAGTCPVITDQMHKLQEALPKEISMVSFTVDPSRDTPEVLAEYARKHNAQENRWFFLTGEKDTLYNLSVKGFKLALDDTGGTEVEPITHSTRLVLVDQRGQIRGYYGGTDDEDMKRLSADAKRLL